MYACLYTALTSLVKMSRLMSRELKPGQRSESGNVMSPLDTSITLI